MVTFKTIIRSLILRNKELKSAEGKIVVPFSCLDTSIDMLNTEQVLSSVSSDLVEKLPSAHTLLLLGDAYMNIQEVSAC